MQVVLGVGEANRESRAAVASAAGKRGYKAAAEFQVCGRGKGERARVKRKKKKKKKSEKNNKRSAPSAAAAPGSSSRE